MMRIDFLIAGKIPLQDFFHDTKFMLKNFRPFFEYKNGVKTEKILGITYNVLELNSLELISIKVPNVKPIVTMEELALKVHFRVAFKAPCVQYYVHNGRLALAFRAEYIVTVEAEEEEIIEIC